MSNQVVKVRREAMVACMRCPLCDKLFRDATTISECLHTFCRKCIQKKLSDEELECCPICNIDLGCAPVEKLRPDHSLQDVRDKIFPSKRVKIKVPDDVPSVLLPVRRKERSLSSLVVNTPRVTQTSMTGRRSKTRKTVRGSSFEKDIMKEEDSVEDHAESSSSRETLTKFTQSIRQNSSSAEPSSHPAATNETENGVESWKGKADLWKPLNYLVEVANRSKSSKFSSQGSAAKSEPHARKNKVKEHGQKFRVQDEKNSNNPGPSESVKPRKLRRQMKAEAFGESTVSPQAVVEAGVERKMNPVWFSLVASNNQGGRAPLPQISASYLRIKDGNVPVSFIQKYLRRKLDLASEDEIEIKCMGQSVVPSWRLNNLVELWLQTTSTSQRVPARIGSSAKEFVLVLAYARKVPVH